MSSISHAVFPDAQNAAIIAPMLEPEITSIGIFSFSSTLSTPICDNPKAAPLPNASPTRTPDVCLAIRRIVLEYSQVSLSIISLACVDISKSRFRAGNSPITGSFNISLASWEAIVCGRLLSIRIFTLLDL